MPATPLRPRPATPQAAGVARMSLSPADCCTLQKMLEQLRVPSPSAATSAREQSESLGSINTAEDERSDPGSEDQVHYTKACFPHGDETEDGYEDEDDSMELSDGVDEDPNADMTLDGVATDVSKVNPYSQPTSPNSQDTQARHTSLERPVQADRGMSVLGDKDGASASLEYFDMRHRRASRRFSPVPISRRASENSPPSSSFLFLPSEPSVVPSPGGTHLEFTSTVTIPDTPFAKTLQYFKQCSGKENLPSKSRRNASLPNEIAGLLARDVGEQEEENLEKYREVDLAPMESVMENATAGDLIFLNTPSKSWNPCLLDLRGTTPLSVKHARGPDDRDILCEQVMAFQKPLVAIESESSNPNILVGLDKDDDANAKTYGQPSDEKQQQIPDYTQHPTFVNVIGLLPQAMFWATAAPVAKLGNKAYDAVVEKLSRFQI